MSTKCAIWRRCYWLPNGTAADNCLGQSSLKSQIYKILVTWSADNGIAMAYGHAFYRSAVVLLFIFFLNWACIDNYKFDHTGYHQAGIVTCVQSLTVFSSTPNSCHCCCLAFVRHLGSSCALHWLVRIRFLGRRPLYSCNGTSSFNPSVIRIVLGGDVHPQPGPSPTALRGSSTARSVASELNVFPKNTHANIKITHLTVRSLRSRENQFHSGKRFYSIGWIWYFHYIRNVARFFGNRRPAVYIAGFSMFRQDLGPQKSGGVLCVYTRDTLKVE